MLNILLMQGSAFINHMLNIFFGGGGGGCGLIYNLYTVPNIVPVFGLNKVKTIQQTWNLFTVYNRFIVWLQQHSRQGHTEADWLG